MPAMSAPVKATVEGFVVALEVVPPDDPDPVCVDPGLVAGEATVRVSTEDVEPV
jgi:hypothetical protein